MDNILQVKRLTISFRTPGGTLKAVRDISFDLERGKTLAIVGESGSGKSVTSKAILGILAGNSIVESGEILYDGKDLLKLPETDMYKIRGDKISMIFQDPLSSLNPIVKIGKQITEAMLLKNKVNRREARAEFNSMLAKLKECIIAAGKPTDETERLISTFDKFNIEAIKLENVYNESRNRAEECQGEISELLFLIERKQNLDVAANLKSLCAKLVQINDKYLLAGHGEELTGLTQQLKTQASHYKEDKNRPKNQPPVLPAEIRSSLDAVSELLDKLLTAIRPNFFRIGYWTMKNPDDDLSGVPADEANSRALELLNRECMDECIE